MNSPFSNEKLNTRDVLIPHIGDIRLFISDSDRLISFLIVDACNLWLLKVLIK